MKRIQKITALLCTLALAVSSLGAYTDNATAAGLPVTSDDAFLSRETMERGTAKANVQKLEFGKKTQGRLVTGDDGQQYQITLDSSGQLDIHLEGAAGKLATRLTDKDGKGWSPRRRTADGKQTYQLKKGTYYYQVQTAKGTVVSKAGMDYVITATFKSAKAKFEDNNTRGKAAMLPLKGVFYGHLAQNEPTQYYKFTLKQLTIFSFSITTQITDNTPETFVVTLYNKYGKALSSWKNPDLVKYYEEYEAEYKYTNGYWWWWDWRMYDNIGLTRVLPPDTYYVGVSINRDKNGKIPESARYGQYAAHAMVYKPSVSVKLSHKQAEYTGKRINPPKVTIKKQLKNAYLERYDDKSPYKIQSMTVGIKDGKLKEIGKYKIVQNTWYNHPETGNDSYSYAIFTVTPIRGKVRRASSKKPGEVQVSIKKDAQSTGYQIQIACDKKFRKSVRTIKTTNLQETLKGLSAGKEYYVRVRNYKDVKTCYFKYWTNDDPISETIYGKWSKTKTVVCK